MNLREMARKARGVSGKVVETVFLESDLRRARKWRKQLEETYGDDARNRVPNLYSMVESIYLIRGAEIAVAGLIATAFCAWATGVIK